MEGLSISTIWRLFKWLPGCVLKRIFTPEKLSKLIYVDLRPRHRQASMNLCEVPRFELYFQIINLSPFNVELDRAEVRFHCAGTISKTTSLMKKDLIPGQFESLYFDDAVHEGNANFISQNTDNLQPSVEIDMEFNCKLHNFSLKSGRLEGVNINLINMRKNT
ncbi:hypothetical protein [Photobacterium marinum]|uniref:hypothetical protein n=1 Tax=Photobacterium marinum TaxID=1056511 RepID=UPI0005682BD8|nr:hypothetical protein [Photobacterium marinum]